MARSKRALLKRIAMSPHVTAAMSIFRCKALPAIREWVQKCRSPDVDVDDVRWQIEAQLDGCWGLRAEMDEGAREGTQKASEDLIQEYLELCQDIATYPEKIVAAVFFDWQRLWSDAASAEDKLAMLEEPVRAVYAALDDRMRYTFGVIVSQIGREGFLEYWSEICDQVADPDFLEAKATDFRHDPQIGVLVKAYELAAVVDEGRGNVA